jgi:hypothetical protein
MRYFLIVDHRAECSRFFAAGAHCRFFPNEMMEITIARKIPYGSPFHDKVCEEKLHLRVKQVAS